MKNIIFIDKLWILERLEQLIKEANAGKTLPHINSQLAESLITFKKEIEGEYPLIPPKIWKELTEIPWDEKEIKPPIQMNYIYKENRR